MNIFKRIFCLLVVLTMVASLTACGDSKSTKSGDANKQGGNESAGNNSSSGEKHDPITIKITTTQNPGQQMGIGAKLLKENIETALGDWANVQVYDSAQLYSGTEEIEACTAGDIQVYFGTGGAQEAINESLMVIKLPYLFKNSEIAYKVLEDTDSGKALQSDFTAAGLTVLGIFNAGEAMIANDKHPIKAPGDCKGLKMRAPGTMDTYTLTALGAVAVTTPAEETYSAVQQGVIEGMTTPTSVFLKRNFNEVQKYVTNPGTMSFSVGYIICNSKWLEGLPEEFREKFNEAVKATNDKIRADIEAETATVYKQCEEAGCEVYTLSDAEIEEWKNATAGVYDTIAQSVGQDFMDQLLKDVEECSK